jgi:hypothetical protein
MADLIRSRYAPLALTWLARACGLGLFLLVATFWIAHTVSGEGPPNPFTQPPSVAVGLLALPAMALGLLAAWRWPVAGALVTLAAWALFTLTALATSGRFLGGAFPLFAVAAVLYLVAAYWRSRTTARHA